MTLKPHSHLDHITVTAANLSDGAAWVTHALGVTPQPGGEHPRMGTHNLLMRLSDSSFLEIIAINPAAPAPKRPRWFDLDRRAPDAPPSLSTWVVRCEDIHASAAASPVPLGAIEPMSRGALNWHITLPPDGVVPLDGVAPALIAWQTSEHPAQHMPELGLRLLAWEIHHPEPAKVQALLAALHLQTPVSVHATPPGTAAHLRARLQTPHGERVLG
jgi:hypothetical protein